MLRYFTCRCLNACSTQPVNIFKIEQKLCILEQNIGFLDFCKQTLNEQQCLMCNKGNKHKNFVCCKILILFHTHGLVHLLPIEIWQFYINQSMCSHFRKFFLLRIICLNFTLNFAAIQVFNNIPFCLYRWVLLKPYSS